MTLRARRVALDKTKQNRKDSSIIILKGTRLEFYLFRKPLQAPLRPVRVLDAVPVADTEQHLELRLRGRAPSAGTKISTLLVCYMLHGHGMHASHVKCRHVGKGNKRNGGEWCV